MSVSSGRVPRPHPSAQVPTNQVTGLHLQTTFIQVNRRVTDRSGVVWSVTEAYEVANNSPHDLRRPEARVAMLWFETESGRTASALIPGRSLDRMDDEDILEFLQVAIERRGRQP